MTWDQRQAAVFSAGIRSHRSASDGPVPERTFQRPRGEFSSWPVIFTAATAKSVALSWLMAEQRQLVKERIQAQLAKNDREVFSIFERTLRLDQTLRFLDRIEPSAVLPPLAEYVPVEASPLTAEELAQAVVLGLRLEGSTD